MAVLTIIGLIATGFIIFVAGIISGYAVGYMNGFNRGLGSILGLALDKIREIGGNNGNGKA